MGGGEDVARTSLWDGAGRYLGVGHAPRPWGAMLKGCNPVGVKGANTENPRLGIPTLPATPRQAPVGSRLGGSPLPSAEAPPGAGLALPPAGRPPAPPAPALVSLSFWRLL